MKYILSLFVCLFSASTLFAIPKAPFASQSDLVADLSDSVLNGIYHHRLNGVRYPCERNFWVDGFGSYRERQSDSNRSQYENGFGGILAGYNYALSCDSYFNFFVGGSYGQLDVKNESYYDTYSLLFGMTWEHFCEDSFVGFAFTGGYLKEDRHFKPNPGITVHEQPRGVFLSPELTYAREVNCFCMNPVFTSTLRYAGFFARDYEYRDILGTLDVQDRTIQMITLRGEFASPCRSTCFEPYVGIAGRFQFDGNHLSGTLLTDHQSFSDGLDNTIVYGFIGVRFNKQCGCFDLQGNVEGSYDTDDSWRVLGELHLGYGY